MTVSGCSSVVEHHVANVIVESSILFTRSLMSIGKEIAAAECSNVQYLNAPNSAPAFCNVISWFAMRFTLAEIAGKTTETWHLWDTFRVSFYFLA